MRHPHLTSGGRYPAVRAIAVLCLFGGAAAFGLGVWQAVRVVVWGADEATEALSGWTHTGGDVVVAVACWLAVGFLALLSMLAVAELLKLFVDIAHNTRAAGLAGSAAAGPSAATEAAIGGDAVGIREGPAVPLVGDRKLLDGDETAEGALLRGH